MGQVWVKEFTGGLDVRRLPETTPGGVLVRGADGHITRGGEFEKRAAFVKAYNNLTGTVGLACTSTGLVVFGNAPRPFLPTGVEYQRLRLSDASIALKEVLSYDLYDGKLYVVARFADGSVHHFYNGARVEDWFDGRARTAFRVTGGTTSSSVQDISVGGVSIIGASVSWATSNRATAAAIAAAINAHTSSPDYTAFASGNLVNIVATEAGEGQNGREVAVLLAGGLAINPTDVPALSGGGTTGGKPASGSFVITAGPGTILPSINGVNLTSGAVSWSGDADATASAVAAAINSHTSVPDYTASANGAKVTVRTATNTAAANGKDIDVALTGNLSISRGGAYGRARFVVGPALGVPGATIRVKIAGVNIHASPVAWATSNAATAAAIAAAINSHTSSPDYTATVNETAVLIDTADMTADHNGKSITFTKVGVVPTSKVAPVTGGAAPATTMVPMADGEDDDAFTPGTFVKTVGSKVYSTAGSILHFSGIKEPTQWTTDAIGAGFINMASENSGSEQLTAVERYQSLLAVFSPSVVQVWYIDPDPELNRQSQILNNTGTFAPRSVAQFGDDDIFYLDGSGLRSLRARDSSNAASTTDIGVPIDALLTAKMDAMTDTEKASAIGLINPIDKRFWLIMKDEVFVFSFFANAKVSAWTTYNLVSYFNGDEIPFTADTAVVFNGRVYIRSGADIYVYGGLSGAPVYDQTSAEAWLPPLDANAPTQQKQWTGVDAAVKGAWQISMALEPTLQEYSEVTAYVSETTYNHQRIAVNGSSSHIGLRCRSTEEGPAVLSSVVIHYEGKADED